MMLEILITLFLFLCVLFTNSYTSGKEQKIKIVSIIDESSVLSCLIKVHSIIQSSTDPSHLQFYFIVIQQKSKIIEKWMKSFKNCFPDMFIESKVWDRPESLPPLHDRIFEIEIIFARFYIPHIFPFIDRYIYLDNDMIVTADLSNLYSFPLIAHSSVPAKKKIWNYEERSPHSKIGERNEMHNNIMSKKMLPPKQKRVSRNLQSNDRLLLAKSRNQDKKPSPKQYALNEDFYNGGTKLRYKDKNKAVAAFVFEDHPQNIAYIKSNFNTSHPLVRSTLSLRPKESFFNGGVAVVDASLWRKENFTKQAEKIIENNYNGSLYSHSAGDQGTFLLLLQGRIAYLPSNYNMRRLPKKTVNMLTEGKNGIIHFAGSTFGVPLLSCYEPLRYPIFIPAVVPLYLQIISSLSRQCPILNTGNRKDGSSKDNSSITIHNTNSNNRNMSRDDKSIRTYGGNRNNVTKDNDLWTIPIECSQAIVELKEAEKKGEVKIKYHPGKSLEFGWPLMNPNS
jgi:lipopolysaccharide biosynthesis glycosyltransferase